MKIFKKTRSCFEFNSQVIKGHHSFTGTWVSSWPFFYAGVTDNLGPDPVDTLLNETGIWAIHLLLITLMLSPLAKILPSPEPIKFRRMLGIYSFVYALSHFATYILFELQLDMGLIATELVKRPYIVVGLTALVLLFVLTVTSFQKIRRSMGKRWQHLHNSIYLIVPLALLHFSWSQKKPYCKNPYGIGCLPLYCYSTELKVW